MKIISYFILILFGSNLLFTLNGAEVLSYYFKSNPILSGAITGRQQFYDDRNVFWYLDDTPTGNAVIDYFPGDGLVFNNGQSVFSESQTAIYFNKFNLSESSGFEIVTLCQIPPQFDNFISPQVLSLNTGLFFGLPANEYNNVVLSEFGTANVEGLVKGRAQLVYVETSGVQELFDLEQISNEATHCLTSIKHVANSKSIITKQSFYKLENENDPELLQIIEKDLNLEGYFDSEINFIPTIGFHSENTSIPLPGESFVADNQPSFLVVKINVDQNGNGNPADDRLKDSDQDGIIDLVEMYFGTDPNSPSDLDNFIEIVNNSTLIHDEELVFLKKKGVMIEKNPSSNFVNIGYRLQVSSDLTEWDDLSVGIMELPLVSEEVKWFKIVE